VLLTTQGHLLITVTLPDDEVLLLHHRACRRLRGVSLRASSCAPGRSRQMRCARRSGCGRWSRRGCAAGAPTAPRYASRCAVTVSNGSRTQECAVLMAASRYVNRKEEHYFNGFLCCICVSLCNQGRSTLSLSRCNMPVNNTLYSLHCISSAGERD
jgi:hypothetical protein